MKKGVQLFRRGTCGYCGKPVALRDVGVAGAHRLPRGMHPDRAYRTCPGSGYTEAEGRVFTQQA